MNTTANHTNLENLFDEVDNFQSLHAQSRPPVIGISCNKKDGLSCILQYYVDAVVKAGGAPILIPVMTNLAALGIIVNSLDGLIMSGGADINPLFVNEEPIPQLQDVDTVRDTYDLSVLRLAMNRQLPIMGICRGHQVMNIAFGGSIYQDIYAQHPHSLLKHSQSQSRDQASHTVFIEPGENNLHNVFGDSTKVAVNSFHHQAIKEIAPEFRATATAPDGINEGIEHIEKPVFGIQWHPEAMSANDSQMNALFQMQIDAAARFARAKEFHRKYITIDSHTDTPMIFPGQFDLGKKEGGKVNIPLMDEGLIDASIMVAYIPQGVRNETGYKKAYDLAINRLREIHRQEIINSDRMGIATTSEDIAKLKREEKKSILPGVENGYAIGKDIDKLNTLKELGIVYMTLCHNGDNDICDSAKGKSEWNGISPFGKKVIERMNDLGIMIDISHASEKTIADALEYSRTPIIASHSSARALCDHPRNLTDDQLRQIAAKGGVIQVCLYKGFINKDSSKASLSDAIRHINHIVRVAGIDHIGIGSDFDGDGELIGCRASNELINITSELFKQGYTEEEVAKIWGGNLLRVMDSVQKAALQ